MSQCTAVTNAGQTETTQPVTFVVFPSILTRIVMDGWLDGWAYFICIFRKVTSIE